MTAGQGDLLSQVQQLLQGMQEAQADLGSIEVVGTAGGGVVRVTASATPELRRVEIDAEAMDDAELLGDLVVAAVNDALRKAAQSAQERIGGLQLGGVDLGALGLDDEFDDFDDEDDDEFEDDED